MKIYSIILKSLFILFIYNLILYCQVDSTYISSVRINGNVVLSKFWSNLSISKKDIISFDFNTQRTGTGSEEMLHRIILNGVPINLENMNSRTVSFSLLDSGNYLLKIQGYTKTSNEAKPAYIKFNVDINPITVYNEISDSDISLSKEYYYTALVFISLLLLFNVVYFSLRLLRNKRTNTDPEYKRYNKKELLKEVFSKSENLNDLNYSNSQLKESVKTLREQNNNLRTQVRELKQHIENLEKANSELLEQKTKLEKSIVLGEELHIKKEKLFATAVHDIKNPAAAIKGYVELLESFDLNAVEQQEIIQYLVDTSARIVDLAQKMSVAIAQSDTNTAPNFESSSLKSIIDSVCYQNIANANRKQIKLINNASPQTPKIEIDKEKMHEAIDNVVNNAIKFSYPNSTVIIKSYFNEKKIFIEVIDNGVGMDSDDLNHLFEKGAQLSSKPTGSEESSGLGLWIVKNIIDEHGGTIIVSSKKNAGSTFKIELPLKRRK